MSSFNYTGSGTIFLGNCAPTKIIPRYITEFSIGDSAYIVAKAKIGELKRCVIRQVLVNFSFQNNPVIVYIDTLRQDWIEYELCDLETASEIITTYQSALQDTLIYNALHCPGVLHLDIPAIKTFYLFLPFGIGFVDEFGLGIT
jgi:hypothetical protein